MRDIKKTDILLILILLAVAGAVFLFLRFTERSESAAYAVISIDGEEYGRYPLSKDREIPLKQKDGGENIVVIENGRVFMKSASCPDKLCVKQGEKYHSGESIVCLPNRIVVSVEGAESEIDTIAQ